jgi:hypothetical protein
MPTKYRVECEDGQVRHAPFATLHEAQDWAEWGHACTRNHLIDEVQVAQ